MATWHEDDSSVASMGVESIVTQALVSISSNPSGASVIVNGDYLGVTPLPQQLWDFGTYVVNISLNGYEPSEQTVTIVSGDPVTVNPSLTQLSPEKAVLNVDSTPRGAEVYINGNYEGITYVPLTLDAGSYEVILRLPDYPDYIVNVTLVAGQTKPISHVFTKEAGVNWILIAGALGTAYQMLKGK